MVFDANAYIGRWPGERLAYHRVDDLLSYMTRLGIDRALVSHTIAWQNSPKLGNEMLQEAIAGHPELEPCWVVTPGLQIADEGGVIAFCDQLIEKGVRAVRLFPKDHVYSLNQSTAIELLSELNRRRFLILIDLDQIFTQSGLYDYSASSLDVLDFLCGLFPDLTILLTKAGYRAFQILFPLMQKHLNLYLDLSFFATHQGVETVVDKFGADRILFGTGQPLIDPGGAALRLRCADISVKDYQKIACANLISLLDRVEQKPFTLQVETIPSTQSANPLELLPKDIEITDAHVHMGPYHKFYIPQNSAEDMLRVMDLLHISQSCVASHLAITADWYAGNRLTAKAVKGHRDRFIGYVVVSPNEPELARAEMKLAFDEWGFKGVKLVPDTHLQPIGSEGYRPVFEFASQRHCPVLVHTYHGSRFDDPQLFGEVACNYPEVPIVMVHSGALPAAFPEAIRLAKKYPNLYLDISGSFITGYWIYRMVKDLGADRVLFSSDQPFIDPRYGLGRLLYSGLSVNELKMVLGMNIRRLLTEITV